MLGLVTNQPTHYGSVPEQPERAGTLLKSHIAIGDAPEDKAREEHTRITVSLELQIHHSPELGRCEVHQLSEGRNSVSVVPREPEREENGLDEKDTDEDGD